MSKTVLVADDEPTTRAIVVKCLNQAGYKTLVADDGVKAVEVAEAEHPDVILLDLFLPRRDGYTVLLDLRSRPSTLLTPVVIVSGEDDASQAGVAKVLGAQGFVSKPFRPEELLEYVAEVLRGGKSA